jgi:hypothetical protein
MTDVHRGFGNVLIDEQVRNRKEQLEIVDGRVFYYEQKLFSAIHDVMFP